MKEFLDLLHSDSFYGVSEKMDILKGKNELVTDFSDAKEKLKRIWLKK